MCSPVTSFWYACLYVNGLLQLFHPKHVMMHLLDFTGSSFALFVDLPAHCWQRSLYWWQEMNADWLLNPSRWPLLFCLCFPLPLFPAVVLLNSKETQAELGWTSYPPNGVSVLTRIFHLRSVGLFIFPFMCFAPEHSWPRPLHFQPPAAPRLTPFLFLASSPQRSLPFSHLLLSSSPELTIYWWGSCRRGCCGVQTSYADIPLHG